MSKRIFVIYGVKNNTDGVFILDVADGYYTACEKKEIFENEYYDEYDLIDFQDWEIN